MIADQFKRIATDLAIAWLLLVCFMTGAARTLPAPLDLVALKMLLVSMAFVHAHIVGKLAFPKVNWLVDWAPAAWARIALYIVFVYAYAVGG